MRLRRRDMTGIGPYFSGDADSRLSGIGDIELPIPPQASGTVWPSLPGWPAGLPSIPGLVLPPPGTPSDPGMPPLGVPTTVLAPFLQAASLYTPWAYLTEAGSWQQIARTPEFSVALVPYTSISTLASQFGLAGPVGFVAIVSKRPLSLTLVEAAYTGTPYELFSAEASFRQSDPGEPPAIEFVYWGSLRPRGSPGGGSGDVGLAAASVGASAMFGVQVQYTSTAIRSWPNTAFADAYAAQFGQAPAPAPTEPAPPAPSPGPPSAPAPAPIPGPQAPAEASMLGPLLVGTAAALVGFGISTLIWRRR